MKKRIIGIDVARALAVFGMILVNFKIVFGAEGNPFLKAFAEFFSGKAAATFVVLAGVGLALMTNRAVRVGDKGKLKQARIRIIKRALFLFVVGASYLVIWPADILHFYGLYMVICIFFITQGSRYIFLASLGMIFLYPILMLFFDYESGWDFETLNYLDFWTIKGFLRNLFFNGFHPVFPWTAFMLAGIWLGKQDLYNTPFISKLFKRSFWAFLAIQIFSYAALFFLTKYDQGGAESEWEYILGTSPIPPLPIYMLNGISIAFFTISGCILLARKFEGNRLIQALNKTGQLALSFYVAHVVIGMGMVEIIWNKELGSYSIEFSVIYAILFSLACLFFAQIWLKYKKMGPLEWIMRKLTS